MYKDQAGTKREASEIAAHCLSYYWVILSQPECYSDLLNLEKNKEILKAQGYKQRKVC